MSAVDPLPPFPLEGRDLAQVTRTEVAEAIKIAPEIRSFLGGPSIARVTSSAIVKYGRHIHLHEARNMQYVSENTNIRLPAVVDAWEVEDKTPYDESNTRYIVMEYIEGRLVSDIWDDLDNKGRRNILRQLYEYIRELQALKMDRPGPVGGGISEGSFFTDYGAGPFKSRKDIEDWFNDRLHVCHDFGHASQTPPGWFAGRFDELVMCYLDIHPRNLILDGQGKLWLLDWAFSGAYPPYLETANLIWRGTGDFAAGLNTGQVMSLKGSSCQSNMICSCRSPSSPPGPAQSGDLDVGKWGGKRGLQDKHTEISSETHHSVGTDDNNNTRDTSDEDPRPAKRRKPRAGPAATPTICRRHTPEFRLGQPRPFIALSTTRPKIDDAQPQADHGHLSTFVHKSHRYASRSSRSPSAVAAQALCAY